MSKDTAKMQAKQFWNTIIVACAIWGTILFLGQQGIFIYCIHQCKKSQKILENKYMGPVIVAVQPTARQVAVASTAAQEPVIQYIVTPQTTTQPEPSAPTGTIVSANQIVWSINGRIYQGYKPSLLMDKL